ncbi:DNA-binding protein H-NS [Paraburkholderia sp. BL6669N2]|uniref:H-NS family nucleoid-associated regulatory protein n=1 Tax=Paraburkholderia sp. BL6669N2 TaxID=1938807 RepID=UPI000E22D643|nr:H-NS family nucleoid-associated regulatory protein [Paraburkholderia sp. BL6669N2]REG60851.1 DNA-binding protein H-NS [Paraburkholderia sp. BL6669N2]
MTTLESLQAKIQKLQAQADSLVAKESSAVIEKIRHLMAKHGLTIADIDAHTGGKKRGPKPGAKASPKARSSVPRYRDPKSGATWTGHGRAPSWIAAAKNRDKFLIDGSTATAKPASVSKAKAASAYVRGQQPAMYRDAKSGATWSGRGRAPAWIAEAKDRSKFLIASGAEPTAATSAGTESKAKAIGKKTGSKSVGATVGKGQRKGPQPALYRDPKSRATWSGRGRAPAWLAGAKDRSKFLIDGAGVGAAVTEASKSKVAAKKAVAEEVVAKKAPAAKTVVASKKAPAKNAR